MKECLPKPPETFGAAGVPLGDQFGLRGLESPTRRTVLAGALKVLSLGLKIGANLLIIRLSLEYLGKETYGLWIILQNTAMYLALCSEIGQGQTIMNFVGEAFARDDRRQANEVMTTSFCLYALLASLIWVAMVAVVGTQPVDLWLIRDLPPHLIRLFRPYLIIFGTLSLLWVPLVTFPATLSGLRELHLRQAFETAYPVVMLAATASVLVLGGKLLGLLLVTGLVPLMMIPNLYLIIRRRHPFLQLSRSYWNPSLMWPLFTNSLFFFLIALMLLWQRTAGNLLTGKYASLTLVAPMFALLTILRVFGWSLADIVSRVLLPYVIMFEAQGQRARVIFFAGLSSKVTFAVALFMGALIWLLAEPGLRLWLGPGLFLGYAPLAFLIGSFLIDVLFLPTSNFLLALNRHRALALALLSYGLLSLALSVAGARLMPHDPIYGLTLGFFLASVVGQLFLMPIINLRGLRISAAIYLGDFVAKPLTLALLTTLSLIFLGLPGIKEPWLYLGLLTIFLTLTVGSWFLVFNEDERGWLAELGGKLVNMTQFTGPK